MRIIIKKAILLLAIGSVILSVGCAYSNGNNSGNVRLDWELYTFPYSNYHDPDNTLNADVKVNFNTDVGTYHPSVQTINAMLTNVSIPGELTCGRHYILVKQIGKDWRVVPFAENIGFDDLAILLNINQSEIYTIKNDLFAVELTPGKYRIVTDVWYGDNPRETLTVWADFHLSENETAAALPDTVMPPNLNVILFNTNIPNYDAQNTSAIQLGCSWMVVDENGVGRGIEADAPHPMQIGRDRYDESALLLNNASCDCIEWREHIAIMLLFGDDYQPDSISVIRWDASLLTGEQDIEDIINDGVAVETDGYIIHIPVDDNDYVYSIHATWSEGISNYAFLTVLRS